MRVEVREFYVPRNTPNVKTLRMHAFDVVPILTMEFQGDLRVTAHCTKVEWAIATAQPPSLSIHPLKGYPWQDIKSATERVL